MLGNVWGGAGDKDDVGRDDTGNPEDEEADDYGKDEAAGKDTEDDPDVAPG